MSVVTITSSCHKTSKPKHTTSALDFTHSFDKNVLQKYHSFRRQQPAKRHMPLIYQYYQTMGALFKRRQRNEAAPAADNSASSPLTPQRNPQLKGHHEAPPPPAMFESNAINDFFYSSSATVTVPAHVEPVIEVKAIHIHTQNKDPSPSLPPSSGEKRRWFFQKKNDAEKDTAATSVPQQGRNMGDFFKLSAMGSMAETGMGLLLAFLILKFVLVALVKRGKQRSPKSAIDAALGDNAYYIDSRCRLVLLGRKSLPLMRATSSDSDSSDSSCDSDSDDKTPAAATRSTKVVRNAPADKSSAVIPAAPAAAIVRSAAKKLVVLKDKAEEEKKEEDAPQKDTKPSQSQLVVPAGQPKRKELQIIKKQHKENPHALMVQSLEFRTRQMIWTLNDIFMSSLDNQKSTLQWTMNCELKKRDDYFTSYDLSQQEALRDLSAQLAHIKTDLAQATEANELAHQKSQGQVDARIARAEETQDKALLNVRALVGTLERELGLFSANLEESLTTQNQRIASVEEDQQNLRNDVNKMGTELTEAWEQRMEATLQGRYAPLETAIKALQSQVKSLESELQHERAQKHQSQQMNESSHKSLERTISDLALKVQQLEDELSVTRDTTEKSLERHDWRIDVVEKMHSKDVKGLASQIQSLEANVVQNDQKTQAALASLQQQHKDEGKALQARLKAIEDEVKVCQKQYSELVQDRESWDAKLERCKKNQEAMTTDLSSQVKDLEWEVGQTQKKVMEASEEMKKGHMSVMNMFRNKMAPAPKKGDPAPKEKSKSKASTRTAKTTSPGVYEYEDEVDV